MAAAVAGWRVRDHNTALPYLVLYVWTYERASAAGGAVRHGIGGAVEWERERWRGDKDARKGTGEGRGKRRGKKRRATRRNNLGEQLRRLRWRRWWWRRWWRRRRLGRPPPTDQERERERETPPVDDVRACLYVSSVAAVGSFGLTWARQKERSELKREKEGHGIITFRGTSRWVPQTGETLQAELGADPRGGACCGETAHRHPLGILSSRSRSRVSTVPLTPTSATKLRWSRGGWGPKRRGDRRWRGSVCRATRSVCRSLLCPRHVSLRAVRSDKRHIKRGFAFRARDREKRLCT